MAWKSDTMRRAAEHAAAKMEKYEDAFAQPPRAGVVRSPTMQRAADYAAQKVAVFGDAWTSPSKAPVPNKKI